MSYSSQKKKEKEMIFKKYNNAIKQFEDRLKIFKTPKNPHNGHLIKLSEYEKLKNTIGFNKNKSFSSISPITDSEKIMNIDDLAIKSLSYLNNLILNENKYIIIDNTFWKVVNKTFKDEGTVFDYKIDSYNIIFTFRNNEELKFKKKDNSNIINKELLISSKDTGFNEILKIYKSIEQYYNFENTLEAKTNSEYIKGYIVEKEWLDSWKRDVNYDKIKSNFLIKKIDAKETKNELIYLYEKKEIKYKDLADAKKLELNTKKKFEDYLKTNSLVLLSDTFISSFGKKQDLCGIKYKLLEKGIEINFDSEGSLILNVNDNIIPKNSLVVSCEKEEIKHEVIKVNVNTKNKEISDENADINANNNNEFAENIISFLLKMFFKEKELNGKIDESKTKNNNSTYNYSLANYTTFNDLKNFFSYDNEIKEIIKKFNIKGISDINQNLLNKIIKDSNISSLSQKDNFFKNFSFDKFFGIKSDSRKDFSKGKTIIFPVDFIIIDNDLVEDLLNIFDIKVKNNIEEIELGFNDGNIIFRPEKGSFAKDEKYFAYVFSITKEPKDIIKFNPEILIYFNDKKSMINNFKNLLREEDLDIDYENKKEHININFKCTAFLMNKKNIKNNTGSSIASKTTTENNTTSTKEINTNTNNEKEKSFKYISCIIKLHLEYLKFKDIIEKPNNKQENECYLVNKTIVEDIENILYFNEINKILIKNKDLLKNCEQNEQKMKEIINKIDSDIIKKLNKLDDKIFESKENKLFELSKSFIDEEKKVFYYENCKIINKDIFGIIKEIINVPINNIKSYKSIYDNKNIIILINDGKDDVINIGNLDNENNFIIKYAIQKSDILTSLPNIFDMFRSFGYDYFKQKIPSGKISLVGQEARIYSLSEQNNNNNAPKIIYNKKSISSSIGPSGLKKENSKKINDNKKDLSKSTSIKQNKEHNTSSTFNKSNTFQNKDKIDKKDNIQISEKLKSLLLLSINQQKDYSITNSSYNMDKKGYKVYLINSNLEKYKFSQINSEIKLNSSKIDASMKEINKSDFPTIISKISEICPKLNQDKLKQLNDEINKIQETTSFQFEPKSETINLLNSKNIKIYTDFIISPENTYNQLKKSFAISQDIKSVYYIHITSGDIIYFDKILLYGKIDKNKNKYEIKYIFEFDTESDLTKEITEIKNGVESYIRSKSVFIDSNKNDIISPIFSFNKTIGNVYKYNSNTDYSKCIDYTKYIKNDKLSKFIALYKFYSETKKNLNKFNNKTEKYFLLKESTIYDIQNSCNYNEIKQIFEEKNINLDTDIDLNNKDDKKLLKAIKNIPKEILDKNFMNNSPFKKIKNIDIEPDLITVVNPNNPNEYAMAYDNFGIIDKKIAELFIEGIASTTTSYSPYSSKDKNCFDCTLNEGKILIDYQKKIGNEYYVSIIGSVDPINFFIINEYALIYKDPSGCSSHNNSIKNKLNNFIQGLQLYNRVQPITQDITYKEIGNIIEIEQTTGKKNKIITKPITTPKPTFDPTPIPPKPSIPNPPYDDEEYNLNSKIKNIFSISQYFTYPPLIGLENIGATCYMNATLQCFCNVEKFVDYFKYNKHLIDTVKNDINKRKLCSSFKLLIEKLWPDDYTIKIKTYYAPHEYKKKISSMDSLFQGVQANDSKDLVNFIIMTLHTELNKAINFNITSPNPSFDDQRNQQIMLNNFIQSFQATNKSLISDLFYAVNCNIIQCLGCNAQTFNYQTYFFIVFPLEEVRKYKFQNINQFNSFNNMFNNNNQVNIYECFEYEKKITYMSGQNAMHCNYCQRTCNSSMCTVLTTGPEVLIIILNRGKGIEFNVKIIFDERLNLNNYIQFGNTGVNYELIGVITHLGDSSMSGHFIAYCKSPISKTWFQYNDAMVNPVNNFRTEVIDFAMPYLLFYQKMH